MKFELDRELPLNEQDLAFLNDWLDWVERGAPEDQPYSRGDGLCVVGAQAVEGCPELLLSAAWLWPRLLGPLLVLLLPSCL